MLNRETYWCMFHRSTVPVGERYFPTDISIMLMRILMGLGLLSISVVGTCLISNELPIRIIVEKDEEKMR